ncbi:MAG: hypothetical protein ABEK50_02435 [bacterium]
MSLSVNEWPKGWGAFLLLSPVPSYRTWLKQSESPVFQYRNVAVLILELSGLAAFYYLPSDISYVSHWHWFLQAYLAIVPFVVLVDALGQSCRMIYGLFGFNLPHIHNGFLNSKKLSGFWNRWNSWFADFLQETCFRAFIRRPQTGMATAFAMSGIFHEYLVNLPLYWVFRQNLFGTMMLYFLIQAVGILLQRNFLGRGFWINWIWTWLVVILPAPLVLNRGTLLIFHLGFFG